MTPRWFLRLLDLTAGARDVRRWLAVVLGTALIVFGCACDGVGHGRERGFSRLTPPLPVGAIHDTLWVDGRDIKDTCGNRLVLHGIEHVVALSAPLADGGWAYDSEIPPLISAVGANVMRALFDVRPGAQDLAYVDRYLAAASDAGLVTFVDIISWEEALTGGIACCQPDAGITCPLETQCPAETTCDTNTGDCQHTNFTDWYVQPANKAVLDKYQRWLVVDTVTETYDLPTVWRDNAIRAVQRMRDAGYTEPLDVIGPNAGRDLPSILTYGAAIQAADPLHNVLLDWHAYWGMYPCDPQPLDAVSCMPQTTCGNRGTNPCCGYGCQPTQGWYQGAYGGQAGLLNPTSLVNGVEVAADAGFAVMAGFDFAADNDELDDWRLGPNGDGGMFGAAARTNTSWLWWWLVGPETPLIHNALLDPNGWASCSGTFGPFGHVCTDAPDEFTLTCEAGGAYCAPHYSYAPTVFRMMDAGTNRACGL